MYQLDMPTTLPIFNNLHIKLRRKATDRVIKINHHIHKALLKL